MVARLNGKIAIVTGAASGIGLAITEAFVAEGASVALFDRDAALLGHALVGSERVSRHVCDVTDANAVDAAIAAARERFGPINVLVNNAGIAISGGLEE